MFTSAELIQALQRRFRRSIRPLPPGEFPPQWAAWFEAMKTRVAGVTGATRDAVIAIFLARQPVFPRGYERLGTVRALLRLWRYDWRGTDRGDRGARIASLLVTLLFHLLLLLSMIWLMALSFSRAMGEEEARRGDEQVVQVEFIGRGTPDEDTGGAPQQVEEVPEVATRAPPAATAQQAAATPPLPEPAQAPVQPQPAQPQPPAEQPLQVTETAEPDIDFVVPPVRADIRTTPQVVTPTPVLAEPVQRDIVVPPSPPSLRPLPQREVAVRESPRPQLEAVPRELPMQPTPVDIRPLPGVAVQAPELSRNLPAASARDVPMPTPAPPAAATGSGQSPADASRQQGTRSAAAPSPGAGEGTRPAGVASGSGQAPSPGTGALPTPRRGDDWGQSTRNQPGGTSGLFNADGSPRLAGNQGRVGGGLPPGTVTEDYEKIDRMGTWLKRPPTDYQPTSLDRFWVPNESLLQEWVRRSIQEVLIPIPGTSKSIRCAVALLALGGACGLFDPNMMDVEAEAREPPDVPFKPELQEDQESLRTPVP